MMSERRFGIHHATGIDIASPRNKPAVYNLVEQGRVVATVSRESYAVLIIKKKELLRYGRTSKIEAVW